MTVKGIPGPVAARPHRLGGGEIAFRVGGAGKTVGEPLFGEDWWVADQKLFEESLFRQQQRPACAAAAITADR